MSSEDIIYLEVPLAVLVCIIYIFVGLAIHNYKEKYGHSPWIHESSISCLFGLVVGGLIKYITGISVTFDNTLFFYLVLPPIIFSAGFSLKRKRFFQYIHQIMFFGVIGTIIDVLLIALGALAYCKFTGYTELAMSWNQSLLFASVLAGSDEVSAMSLIRIKDFPRMGALIFGEGVINDALSIVLFKTFLPLYNQEMLLSGAAMETDTDMIPIATGNSPSWYSSGLLIMGSILFQIVCSWIIGMGCGLINAYIMKSFTFTKKFPISQTALVLLFGYLAYTVAEATGVSGILTLFIVAVTLAHYSWYSLSNAAKIATRISFAGMSDIAEGFAFSYVGLSLWGFSSQQFDFLFAFYMLAVVISARMITIYGLFAICRPLSQSFDIPFGEQTGFALGGIVRGCLCWAQILQVKGFPVMVTSTLIIVMTTLMAGGVLLPMIIPSLGLKPASASKLSSNMLAMNDDNYVGNHRGDTSQFNCENGMSPETTQDDMHLTHLQLNQTQYVNRSMLGLSIMPHSPVGYQGGGGGGGMSVMPSTESAFTTDEQVVTLSSLLYIHWIRLDERFLKPWFGGSATDPYRGRLLQDTENVSIYSLGKKTPISTANKTRRFQSYFSLTADTADSRQPRSTAARGGEGLDSSESLFRDLNFSAESDISVAGDGNDEADHYNEGAMDDISQISFELNQLADEQHNLYVDENDIILDGDASFCSISSPLGSATPNRQHKQLRWCGDNNNLLGNSSSGISPVLSSASLQSDNKGMRSVDITPQKQNQRVYFEMRSNEELSAIKPTIETRRYGGTDSNTK